MRLVIFVLLTLSLSNCHQFITLKLKESHKLDSTNMLVKHDPLFVENLKEHKPTKNLQAHVKLGKDKPFNLELDTYDTYSWVYGSSTSHKPSYTCTAPCSLDQNALSITNSPSPGAIKSTQCHVTGKLATDHLTLNKVKIEKFPIVIADKVKENKARNSDGVLALGYKKDGGLLHALKKEKKINKEVFSVYLGEGSKFLTLGDHEKYLSNNDFKEFKHSVKHGKWALSTAKLHFNLTNPHQLLTGAETISYLDFANDGIYLPAAHLAKAKDALNKHFGSASACKIVTTNLECECSHEKKFPNLDFFLHNEDKKSKVQIKGKNLISKHDEKCVTKLHQGEGNDLVLGRVIAEDHTLVFNQESQSISIGSEYQTKIASHKISKEIMGVVIGLGVFFVLASIVALIAIMKPVEDSPPLQKVNYR